MTVPIPVMSEDCEIVLAAAGAAPIRLTRQSMGQFDSREVWRSHALGRNYRLRDLQRLAAIEMLTKTEDAYEITPAGRKVLAALRERQTRETWGS